MSLFSRSLKFTTGTLLSRVTGLLRDMVVASVFGASSFLDAFLLANRIPNLLRDMLAEGALGSSFTKVYSSLCVQDRTQAQRLLSDVIKLIFLIILFICILGIIFSPLLVKCFTFISDSSGRDSDFYSSAITLTRILFPTLIFATVGSILMGVLSEKGKFFLSAVSSVFLNLGYIIGALIFANIMSSGFSSILSSNSPSITGLAFGVVLGSLLQLLSMIWGTLKELKELHFFSLPHISGDVKKVFWLLVPAAIGSSAGSINVFINTNFAASLPTGSITWLNYAFRLIQLPVGLFGVAIGVVALPSLSKKVTLALKEHHSLPSSDFQNACILTLWLLIPCFSIIICNSQSLISVLFGYGNFDSPTVKATSQVLLGYSFCLIPYGLIKVVTSFYYALDKTSYTMKVSLIGIGVNLLACIFLTQRFGALGLSITSSVTLSFNLAILFYGLKAFNIKIFNLPFVKSMFWLGLALGLSIIVQIFISKLDPVSQLTDIDKLRLLFTLVLNSILTGLIFLSCSLIYYGISPLKLKSIISNLRK